MKKILKSPMAIVFLLFASVLIGSNICCTGEASNHEKNTKLGKKISTNVSENKSTVITLTENTFDDKIKDGITLVDFWATWCMPCRIQAPIIEKVSKEMEGKAVVCKIDVDQSPSIADRYGIQGIPTMIIFKDGKAAGQFVGITSKNDIIAALNKLIKESINSK